MLPNAERGLVHFSRAGMVPMLAATGKSKFCRQLGSFSSGKVRLLTCAPRIAAFALPLSRALEQAREFDLAQLLARDRGDLLERLAQFGLRVLG